MAEVGWKRGRPRGDGCVGREDTMNEPDYLDPRVAEASSLLLHVAAGSGRGRVQQSESSLSWADGVASAPREGTGEGARVKRRRVAEPAIPSPSRWWQLATQSFYGELPAPAPDSAGSFPPFPPAAAPAPANAPHRKSAVEDGSEPPSGGGVVASRRPPAGSGSTAAHSEGSTRQLDELSAIASFMAAAGGDDFVPGASRRGVGGGSDGVGGDGDGVGGTSRDHGQAYLGGMAHGASHIVPPVPMILPPPQLPVSVLSMYLPAYPAPPPLDSARSTTSGASIHAVPTGALDVIRATGSGAYNPFPYILSVRGGSGSGMAGASKGPKHRRSRAVASAPRNKWGLRGVRYDPNKRLRPWEVKISVNGRDKSMGYYDTAEQAGLAYDLATLQHRGYAAGVRKLNFPDHPDVKAEIAKLMSGDVVGVGGGGSGGDRIPAPWAAGPADTTVVASKAGGMGALGLPAVASPATGSEGNAAAGGMATGWQGGSAGGAHGRTGDVSATAAHHGYYGSQAGGSEVSGAV